jgi:hypothetical protein
VCNIFLLFILLVFCNFFSGGMPTLANSPASTVGVPSPLSLKQNPNFDLYGRGRPGAGHSSRTKNGHFITYNKNKNISQDFSGKFLQNFLFLTFMN